MKQAPDFRSHLPLLGFTWLLLVAAGLALGSAFPTPALPARPLLRAALLLTLAGGLLSFLHLGHKGRAAMVLRGLSHSWLSREALATGLFGSSLALTLVFGPRLAPWTALSGLLLAASIAFLYRLEAQPQWATRASVATPILSVCLAGALLSGEALLIAGMGAGDLGVALLRVRGASDPLPGTHPEFPSLSALCRQARRARLLCAAGSMGLGLAGMPLAALALQSLATLLDRFDLYAGARPRSPRASLEDVKAARMRAAIPPSTST